MPKGKRLVCGVGINDADYRVNDFDYTGGQYRVTWRCPFYSTWVKMITRAYGDALKARCKTYEGCEVCEEWLTFSNFKSWMEAQDWQGKQLDKDLLIVGNKRYSPDRCVFLSSQMNTFLVDCSASRGEFMLGVSWDSRAEKFKSECRNPFTKKREYLGLFRDELGAHKAWKRRKHELARIYAGQVDDERVSSALKKRYA